MSSDISGEEETFDELFAEMARNQAPITRMMVEMCAKAALNAQDGVDAMDRGRGRSVPTRRQRLAEIMAALDPSRPFVLPSVPSAASAASAASAPSAPRNENSDRANDTKTQKTKRRTKVEDLLDVWDSDISVSGKRSRRTTPYPS